MNRVLTVILVALCAAAVPYLPAHLYLPMAAVAIAIMVIDISKNMKRIRKALRQMRKERADA